MKGHARIGGVPVVGEEGRVDGFISESDLLDALLAGREPSTRARELMIHHLFMVVQVLPEPPKVG